MNAVISQIQKERMIILQQQMLDKNSPIPLHAQLYDVLKQQIDDGEYMAHQAIPSENEISRNYDISRTTARNVISRLVNENFLYRVAGKGTFVSESKITAATISQKGIREQLESMGYLTGTTIIDTKIKPATKAFAAKLNIQEGDPLVKITRLRYVNDIPFSILTNYLSAQRFPGLLDKEIHRMPLCDILSRDYNTVAVSGEETLESVIASSYESQLLKVHEGFHVLLSECILYDQNLQPYELSKVLFRGDRIKLKFKLDRFPSI